MNCDAIRAVIFDCDGVLFDTGAVNRLYYNTILNHFGRPSLDDTQFAYVHMQTADASIAYLFPEAPDYEAAETFRKTMAYADFLPRMKPEPDLKDTVLKLRTRYKTAIATNRSDTMPRVMATFGLTPLFDLVVTALDVEHPKPEPDELLKVTDAFGIRPEEAVYVGDSEVDEKAAQAAGVPFFAFRNDHLKAERHLTALEELVSILPLGGS